jgi:hypothetical protein
MSTATPVAANGAAVRSRQTVAELAGVDTEGALVLDSVASGSSQGRREFVNRIVTLTRPSSTTLTPLFYIVRARISGAAILGTIQ